MAVFRTPHDASAPQNSVGGSVLRQLCESVVILAVAVLSFREFAAEGYLISTGSMAPSLLGYHRQIECPDCHLKFAAGLTLRDDGTPAPGDVRAQDLYADDLAIEPSARCPNCGFDHIPLDSAPPNEGDQLMVHKHAYQFRDPRRWEVIVFRNPSDPLQAYVKRVVGLPGEKIEIIDGDVWANGELQRKPLSAQQGLRILVDDQSYQPQREDDGQWQPRWIPEREESGWEADGEGFVFRSDRSPNGATGESTGLSDSAVARENDSLVFRHWVRRGGQHVTTVRLDHWPAGAAFPPLNGRTLQYDPAARSLSCIGALSPHDFARWENESNDPAWRAAIEELYAASHESPIVDEYAYNRPNVAESFVVRDLMAAFELQPINDNGLLEFAIDDGRRGYRARLDFNEQRAELQADDSTSAVEAVHFPKELPTGPLRIEVSLMDQQLLVAVNDQLLFTPVFRSDRGRDEPPPRRPLRIAAQGGDFRVSQLRVFRDVYYTPKSEKRDSRQLGADEFYVLGDNSPVSIDSRSWDEPAVHRDHLVGKPFMVHLPSQQGELTLFGQTRHVRIPDFSRVRYIR